MYMYIDRGVGLQSQMHAPGLSNGNHMYMYMYMYIEGSVVVVVVVVALVRLTPLDYCYC